MNRSRGREVLAPSGAEPMVLHLFGACDAATATGLRLQLRRASLSTHGRQLVLDLSDVPFMDAAGLASLIETQGQVGDRLTIRNPPKSLLRILKALNLTGQFTIEDTTLADQGGSEGQAPPQVPQ
ncbi:MAG: STAS domain-containing protein [Actinomycetota bacterium]|nr:STAS domain-containing protein [Actinomycetota bacterium]